MPPVATMPEQENVETYRMLRPDPDPTDRTNQQIRDSVSSARDIIDQKFAVVFQKFDGYDKAISVLASEQAKLPNIGMVDADVKHLKELTRTQIEDLKILVQQTFDAFKTLVEETNKLNKTALDAAFAASKEVVATQQTFNDKANTKSEASFTSQIGEVTKRLELNVTGLTDKIDDTRKSIEVIDRRITTIESRKAGEADVKGTSSVSFGHILSAIAIFVSVCAVIVVILVSHH